MVLEKILVIEDEPGIVLLLDRFLSRQGYTVISAADGDSGVEKLLKEKPDLILLDLLLEGKNGLNVLSEIKSTKPETVVIVTSGVESETVINEARRRGAYSYLRKPLDLDRLEQMLSVLKSGA